MVTEKHTIDETALHLGPRVAADIKRRIRELARKPLAWRPDRYRVA